MTFSNSQNFDPKLCLLYKDSSGGESIGCRMYTSMAAANHQSLRLTQECLSLGDKLGRQGVTELHGPGQPSEHTGHQ